MAIWLLAFSIPLAALLADEPGASYEVHGVLQKYDSDQQEARIAHQEIPGYMAAMTMTFKVRGQIAGEVPPPGESIRFTLHVTNKDAWIDHLRSDNLTAKWPIPVDKAPAIQELRPGERFPDAQLIDEDGAPRTLRDFSGQPLAISFIYLGCPLPNYCPLMNANFQEAESLLQRLGLDDKVKLLSLSMDPANDNAVRLREVAFAYRAQKPQWTFAAVPEAQLKLVANATGLQFTRANGQIVHNLRTIVLDSDFRLCHIFPGNQWTPQELVAELRKALSDSTDWR